MSAANLIARGIGFNPGSVKYIITAGLLAGAPVVVIETPNSGGGYSNREVSEFLRYIKKKRKKALSEVVEEIAEELAASPFAVEANAIILESQDKKATKATERKADYKIDYQALIRDTQALNRLVTIYQLYLDDEEAISLLLVS